MKNSNDACNGNNLVHELGTVKQDLTQLKAGGGSAGNSIDNSLATP
jgi:hypothetical protein